MNDISSLIEQDLGQGKRIGSWTFWSCPFHKGDTTPSMAVRNNRYYCFACGSEGDSIDWLVYYRNIPKRDALKFIKGDISNNFYQSKPKVIETPPLVKPNDAWQNATLSEVILAHKNLFEPQGQAVRDYLINRGITESSWITWTLGSGYAYHPLNGRKQISLVIPAFDGHGNILAVKYRFLSGNPRYISRRGSHSSLFGLWQPVRRILFIVEGELNACSVWQVAGNYATVISPGSEGSGHDTIIKLLKSDVFTKKIVWFDSPNIAQKFKSLADLTLTSPVVDGRKLDANAMLQDGILKEFLSRLEVFNGN